VLLMKPRMYMPRQTMSRLLMFRLLPSWLFLSRRVLNPLA